jgi:AraC-like DNA-binding protein
VECHRLLGEVPPQFSLDHRSQLLRVTAAILTVEFMNARGQRVGFIRPEEHMIQVFEKLSAAELLGLSVGELAGKFGCSRRHLNRLFHQHFGVSVAAIRMEMRLLKAVALLRNPDAKVINVAEECGFNHLGLFNICFKRRFGTSPGQWRKKDVPAKDQPAGPSGAAPDCPLRVSGLCPWTGPPEHRNAVPQQPSQIQKAAPAKAAVSAHALDRNSELPLLAEHQKLNKGTSSRPIAASR